MTEKDILQNEKTILPTEEEIKKIFSKSQNLSIQSFSTIEDPSKITPLTPEIMSRQATMNIGTIGHVAHGKTTLVRAISGIQTTNIKSKKKEILHIISDTPMLNYINVQNVPT